MSALLKPVRAFRRRVYFARRRARERYRFSLERMRIRVAHLGRMARYLAGIRTGNAAGKKATVVLLQYRRPFNLFPLLSAVLLCRFVDEVIVSVNDPAIGFGWSPLLRDPRVRVVRHGRRRFASVRFELALEARNEWVVAIDDDVFPTPAQIAALFESAVADPSVPHGFGGDLFGVPEDDERAHSLVYGVEGVADSLVWAFAFTRAQTRRYYELARLLGFDDDDGPKSSEDVLLSYAGAGLSRIHHAGPLLHCPTSSEPGIATWREGGFFAQRAALVARMREITGYPPARTR